jgi:hypothetical protein
MRTGSFSEFLHGSFWDKSFLPEFWNDFGILATLLGLAIAICQLRKTTAAANAAQEAAQNAFGESRKSWQRYNGFTAQQQVEMIKIHISHNDWKMSASELNHLARHSNAVAYTNSPPSIGWREIAERAREWSETFATKSEDKEMLGTQLRKWRSFLKQANDEIDNLVAGMHPHQEDE